MRKWMMKRRIKALMLDQQHCELPFIYITLVQVLESALFVPSESRRSTKTLVTRERTDHP